MPRVPSAAAAHVGEHMKTRRSQLGMTQDQVGVACGIESSNIRAFEKGRAMPSIHSLLRIASALDCDPGSLIAGLTLDHFVVADRDGRRRGA